MGEGYIVRRGGSGGLSKCSIIVHAETGSTVAAYSNSSATTLVKSGKEIGTSGGYVITGLNTGTYYVKATKGTKSKTSSAITFTDSAVTDVVLAYSVDLFTGTFSHSETSRSTTLKNLNTKSYTSTLNLTGIDSLSINVSSLTLNGASVRFFINSTSVTKNEYASAHPSFNAYVDITSTGIKTLDVSSLTGNYYFGISILTGTYGDSRQTSATVTKIVGEM